MNLEEIINGIRPLDQKAMELCKERWNTLGKPLYSLGRLEEMVIQMAGIYRHPMAKPKKKASSGLKPMSRIVCILFS